MSRIGLAALFVVCLGLGGSAIGLTAPAVPDCYKSASTQAALNGCASSEAGRARVQLDQVYQKLLQRAAQTPGAVSKIKVAEAAWLAYRVAYIDAAFPLKNKALEYGSIYPMEVDEIFTRLTDQHIIALKALLDSYTGK